MFQDEHGDFPAGTYVRNSPTTSHTPSSQDGCTIFVKLWQFDMEDRHQMRIDTPEAEWQTQQDGSQTLQLYQDTHEHVYIARWYAGQTIKLDAPSGMEILVLTSSFTTMDETFETQSWLRFA